MARKIRPYLFYDVATSICSDCLMRVEAKILIRDQRVFLEKWCPQHGRKRILIADDADYYRTARERFIKPPEMPKRFNTPMRWGCPYDCGLCPDHMQHSCLSVVEINDHCNLSCPICYANSSPKRLEHKSLAEIDKMLCAVTQNEGKPDVVQISGGEPTLHPEFFSILDKAKCQPIKHLMLNTNGIRIAQDAKFCERLAQYQPGFEIYLQFDSLVDENIKVLRGTKLLKTRMQALERLNQHNLSTTLVVTLMKGVNDQEIGDLIDFALQQDCVRGVTFQPVQAAGRIEGYQAERHRLTLTEVRREIASQSNVFSRQDIVPVPCNPDCLAMGYAIKHDSGVTPLTGVIDPQWLLDGPDNTIVFEQRSELRRRVTALFSTSLSPESSSNALGELLCCLPKIETTGELDYSNVFRILIMQFLDVHSFDVRVAKKSCVHFAQANGDMIPFDTYNLFYRDELRDHLQSTRQSYAQLYQVRE